MINLVLKHYLYDYCIGLIFDNIKTNFSNIKNPGIPGEGEKFSKIIFNNYKKILYYLDCVIINSNHEGIIVFQCKKVIVFNKNPKYLVATDNNFKSYISKEAVRYLTFKK